VASLNSMNKIKSQIPNVITLLNLASGCISIILASKGLFKEAFCCVLIGSFFDFFDGVVARLLKVTSELGKELDSFSDLVTFGMAPFMLNFFYFQKEFFYLACFFIMIPLFVALRLARFNIRASVSTHFEGLPSPIVGIVVAVIPLVANFLMDYLSLSFFNIVTVVLVASSALLMLTECIYTKFDLTNKKHIAILILSLSMIVYSVNFILLIYVLYLISPLFFNIKKR